MRRWIALAMAMLTACGRDFSHSRMDPIPDTTDAHADDQQARAGCDHEALMGPELKLVPAGGLMIGADDLSESSMPVVWTEFDEFCIDRTEVTVADYALCVEAGACRIPNTLTYPNCNWAVEGREEHPVSCINYDRARTYCEWAGKRLPSEREWEYAARGPEGRKYPWGDAEPMPYLINWNNPLMVTAPVGSYPRGATPDTELLDMAGNVWEWTASEWCDTYAEDAPCNPANHVARGGSFGSTLPMHVRPAWRDPDSRGDNRFGFRCALGAGERR